MNKTKNRVAKIAILTPYLSSGESVLLKTENGIKLFLGSPNYVEGKREFPWKGLEQKFDFAVAGSTTPGEREVMNLKGSGLVIARYSIFYGERSSYSGNSPEETGYSLDIPKNSEIVRELITHDGFLEALLERDEIGIHSALKEINSRFDWPILATPYLGIALKEKNKEELIAN